MIKAIETTATISSDHQVTLAIVDDLLPGQYRVIILIDESPARVDRPPLDLPVHDVGPWPEGLSLRREDMYDDRI